MPVRSWDCSQVWSKAKSLGRYLGGLVVSGGWVEPASRNVELGFGCHFFVRSLLSVGMVVGSRQMGFSRLCMGKLEAPTKHNI